MPKHSLLLTPAVRETLRLILAGERISLADARVAINAAARRLARFKAAYDSDDELLDRAAGRVLGLKGRTRCSLWQNHFPDDDDDDDDGVSSPADSPDASSLSSD